MVTFIDYEMPIIADDIIDLSFTNKALDQCDIKLPLWCATTTAYQTYRIVSQARNVGRSIIDPSVGGDEPGSTYLLRVRPLSDG